MSRAISLVSRVSEVDIFISLMVDFAVICRVLCHVIEVIDC